MSERTRMKMVQSECVACKGAGLVDGWPCGCFGGKRLYPAKAFHTCQGLYFQGKSDGSIEVFLDESGVGLGKFIHITLDKDTWQSMLREIAPGGGAHECERIVSHGDYFDHPESQSDKCSMCHPELGRRETAKPPQLLKEPVRVSSNITPKHDSHLVCGNGHEIDAEHLEAFKRAINAEPAPSAPPADPTLHARVEALSAALREMDAAAEQTIRTFDCDGRNYSLTRRLREARDAARKLLEENHAK